MRIALVIPYNPLEEVGGLELATMRHAVSLTNYGQNVTIITKGKSGSLDGTSIIGHCDFPELCRFLINQADDFDIIHWLEIFPESGEVDLQCMTSGLLRAFGKKVLLMVATSGNLQNRGSGYLITPLLKSTFDAYIVSNPEQINEFAKSGIEDNIYVIGFGIDTVNIFRPLIQESKMKLRNSLNLPKDKILCLFIGRFVERKRPDFLLQAWQSLNDIYSGVELVIVGSGMEQHDSIEDSVIDLVKKTDHVHFRGLTANPEYYYQACDMLLLPSNREGQPNVLMEMMACGNPAIGSDIPGIRELIVNNVTGITFPVNDCRAFQAAIRTLVADDGLRKGLGEAARDKIVKEKDLKVVTNQYLELYKKIRGGD